MSRTMDPKRFGLILRELRGRRSLAEVADESGVPQHSIGRLERGDFKKPPFPDLIHLARAYGLSPNDIAELAGLYVSQEGAEYLLPENVSAMLQDLRHYIEEADDHERQLLADTVTTLLRVRRSQRPVANDGRIPQHIRERIRQV